MQTSRFSCTKHAVINALTDLLHRERFFIRDINDRKGFIYAQQGLRAFAIGRICKIKITEIEAGVDVEVACSNKWGIGLPGLTTSIEKKILLQLTSEL